jgi:hypothetical protein
MGIVQIVTTDPAPSNIGDLGGAGDPGGAGGSGHLCVASASGFAAGNLLLGLGETANFATTTAVKWSDPVNGDWQPLIHLNCRTPPGNVTDDLDVILACMPVTQAIAPGFVGKISASSAGSATCTNFDATTPNLSAFVGATFIEYSTGVTGTVSSVTGAGNNVLNFSGGGTPPVGNPMVVGGFIKFVNTSSGEDYTAATVVNINQIDATNPIIGYCARQNIYALGANLSTGTIKPWIGPALAISFGMDGEDNSAGPFNPLADTRNIDDGVFWKFNLSSAIMRMQHAVVTSPDGVYGMNFTVQGGGDHHMAFLIVLRLAAAATPATPSGIILPRRRAGGLSMDLNIKEWW